MPVSGSDGLSGLTVPHDEMKILFLAPQPFYEERGTLIAVDLLLRALAERGDKVDLLTMHVGEERKYSGLRIFRIRPWPRPKTVKPGLSLAKIWCDLFLFFAAVRLARKEQYELIYGVEEAGFMALVLGKLRGTPYVFDVDSSMTTQIIDRAPWLSPLAFAMRWLESIPARHAAAVVPMCDSLATEIARVSPQAVFILHDICLPGDPEAAVDDLRDLVKITDELIVMYVGNLESYQGIDLLLESFEIVVKAGTRCRLIIIGGRDTDVASYQARADQLNIRRHVDFIGPRPVGALDKYLRQADVLVSPRIHGTNTPMKIYSYLGSGRAVVATNLQTHTQVMDDTTSALAAPEPSAFAEALMRVLASKDERDRLGNQAAAVAQEKYSWTAFRGQVDRIFDFLEREIANDRDSV